MHDCCKCSCKCRVKIDMSMARAIDMAEKMANCGCFREWWETSPETFKKELIFEDAYSHTYERCEKNKLKDRNHSNVVLK